MHDSGGPKAATGTAHTPFAAQGSASLCQVGSDGRVRIVQAPAERRFAVNERLTPASESDPFALGYWVGHGNGYDAGYAHGRRDESAEWQSALTGCTDTWRRPNHAELEQRRTTLRECHCDRCSACVRRAAVERNRERFGADDYPGQVAA
jgi:hypothetical protein